jgi:hypothetical protein
VHRNIERSLDFARDDKKRHANIRFEIIRVDSCPFVVKQKAMRGRAWLSCQSGNRALAPFDGITRIRFKGSVAGATLSAIAAPPQYCFSVRIGLAQAKSI